MVHTLSQFPHCGFVPRQSAGVADFIEAASRACKACGRLVQCFAIECFGARSRIAPSVGVARPRKRGLELGACVMFCALAAAVVGWWWSWAARSAQRSALPGD